MNLNKVMLIGNLTRDPELKTTTTGQTVTHFGLATNRVWKDDSGAKKEKAEFHNVVAWGKLADICSKYLGKGRKIYIEGRLQTRDWQDQEGKKHYRTEVVAENMIMLDRAGATAAPTNSTEVVMEPVNHEEVKAEEIPF
jgi:single-strand DNA-binding protein